MKGSEDAQFKQEIKQMIIDECRMDNYNATDILDDEYLAGSESRFGLDSIDMLQVIVAIKNNYNIRIQNDANSREILATINNLADYLQPS